MKKRTKLFNLFIDFLLDLFLLKKDSWKREEYYFLLSSLLIIPFHIFKGQVRDEKFVEEQYDRISGSYIKDNYHVGKERYCVVNDKVKKISSIENMKLIRTECNSILDNLEFSSILEVGAGELTTMESIYSHRPSISKMFAIDLSLNRLLHGLEEFEKRHEFNINLSKSNAISLPFEDSSFDLVYSRHTLEQMPRIFTHALTEMIRVSRKSIVLFEPSFEKGSLSQKLKMIKNDYFRGLDQFLSQRQDITIKESFLMKNSANPLNHTACYIIEKKDYLEPNEELIKFVCPISKKPLLDYEDFFYCKDSKRAYPKIKGIPILDQDYSFLIDSPKVTNF